MLRVGGKEPLQTLPLPPPALAVAWPPVGVVEKPVPLERTVALLQVRLVGTHARPGQIVGSLRALPAAKPVVAVQTDE